MFLLSSSCPRNPSCWKHLRYWKQRSLVVLAFTITFTSFPSLPSPPPRSLLPSEASITPLHLIRLHPSHTEGACCVKMSCIQNTGSGEVGACWACSPASSSRMTQIQGWLSLLCALPLPEWPLLHFHQDGKTQRAFCGWCNFLCWKNEGTMGNLKPQRARGWV